MYGNGNGNGSSHETSNSNIFDAKRPQCAMPSPLYSSANICDDDMPNEHERVRPRLLYSSIFVWISLCGGRFLAPQLRDVGFSDSQIGLCLALQTVIQSACSSASGVLADAQERKQPGRGRAHVLVAGILVGSAAFLLEGLHHIWPSFVFVSRVSWHVTLRCFYAGATSIVFPVLDGLTLDYLEHHGNGKTDFGKERLYGAIWWAITNLIMGPSLDRLGFSILYIYAIVSTLAVVWTVALFTASQERQHQVSTTDARNEKEALNEEQEEDKFLPQPTLQRQKSHMVETKHTNTLPLKRLLGVIFCTTFGFAFMLAIFCLSIGTAVVESLVFLYFEDLGSSFTLCALTVLLTVLFEIPIFQIAPDLLKKYGSTKLLLLACLCYVSRVVGYSFVPKGQPGWVLVFEPLHGITYACASLSSVEFVSQLMPEGYDASGQGLLFALRGCGSLIGCIAGGVGEDYIGARTMYRLLAGIVFAGFTVLTLSSLKEEFTSKVASVDESLKIEETDGSNLNESDSSTLELVVSAEGA